MSPYTVHLLSWVAKRKHFCIEGGNIDPKTKYDEPRLLYIRRDMRNAVNEKRVRQRIVSNFGEQSREGCRYSGLRAGKRRPGEVLAHAGCRVTSRPAASLVEHA